MDVKRESQVEAILLRPEADLIKSDVPNLCKAECDGVGPSSSASSSSNDAKPHELGVKPEPVDPIGVGAAPMSVDDEVRPEVIQVTPPRVCVTNERTNESNWGKGQGSGIRHYVCQRGMFGW